MSKKMGGVITVYGVILATLGFLSQQIAPAFAKVTLIAGAVGGGLCLLWGVIALAGYQRRTSVVLTMTTVAITLLTQVVQAWLGATEAQVPNLTGQLVPTLMLAITMGMLMYVLHGERTPEFYECGSVDRNDNSSPQDQARISIGGRRP